MTKWQTFMETIRSYTHPEVQLCRFCGHVVADPIGANGQPVKYCNDDCRRAHSNMIKYARRDQIAKAKASH